MYIWITKQCNMTCEHCINDCGPNGEHMTLKMAEKAIDFALNWGEYIILGGGEPTLHPNFWDIVALSLQATEGVWLATNGSQTKKALILANMARKGVLSVCLSQDSYHDPIDWDVIEAFQEDMKPLSNGGYVSRNERDLREIRCVDSNIFKGGRAKENKIFTSEQECCGADLSIMINGDLKPCSCIDGPVIGHIDTFNGFPEYWDASECWKEQSDEAYKELGIKPPKTTDQEE